MQYTFQSVARLISLKGMGAILLAIAAFVLPACGVGEEEGVYEGEEQEEVLEEDGALEEEEGIYEEEEEPLEEE